MKKKLLSVIYVKLILCCTIFIFSCSHPFAQTDYTISKEPGNPKMKMLTGIINKNLIEKDTSFKWYAPNKNTYAPDTAVVKSMVRAKKQQLQFVIFGGTWCEDTQFILPKFFKLQEMSVMSEDNVSLFAVYPNKKTLGNISAIFGITKVPTIIVMKDGKEMGRVVEYGKTGKWDAELADIINTH